jgi:hypothetical protein
MKTCKRCGTMNLEWDMAYHEITKKWKLMEHKTSKGIICGRVQQKVLNKVDAILCELCKETSFGLCRSQEGLEAHLKLYHPKGEVRTELDYIAEFMSDMTIKRFWEHDPHWGRYVNSEKDL